MSRSSAHDCVACGHGEVSRSHPTVNDSLVQPLIQLLHRRNCTLRARAANCSPDGMRFLAAPSLGLLLALGAACGTSASSSSRSEPPGETCASILLGGTGAQNDLLGRQVAIADFDGDGRPDLAFADPKGSSLRIFINAPSGFGRGAALDAASSSALAAGDFDGDHRQDLAWSSATGIRVVLGAGDGTFGPPFVVSADNLPGALFAADLDGDGRDDLVSAGASLRTFLRLGASSVVGPRLEPGLAPGGEQGAQEVAIADVDADGHPDVLSVAMFDGVFHVFRGRGDGTFEPASTVTTVDLPTALIAVDVDRDGRLDVVTADFSFSRIAVHRGHGDGTFEAPAAFPAPQSPAWLGAKDVPGAPLDLVVGTENRQVLTIFRGRPDGTFGSGVAFDPALGNVTALALRDLDGDDRADLLVAGTRGLSVLPKACP